MLKLYKSALVALLGLGMASSFAQSSGFRLSLDGNRAVGLVLTDIGAATNAGTVGAVFPGYTYPDGQVRPTLQAATSAPVPQQTARLPIVAKAGMSAVAIGKGLAKGVMLAAAAGVVLDTASDLYRIWADVGGDPNRLPGQPVQPQTFTHRAQLCTTCYNSQLWRVANYVTVVAGYGSDQTAARSGLISATGATSCQQLWNAYRDTYSWSFGYPGFTSVAPQSGWEWSQLECAYGNGQKLSLVYQLATGSFTVTPPALTPYTQQQLEDMIAQTSGWPDSSMGALREALKHPEVQQIIADDAAQRKPMLSIGYPGAEYQTADVGSPLASQQVTQNPDGTTTTRNRTTSTTATVSSGGDSIEYKQSVTEVTTVVDAQGNPVSTSTSTTTTPQTPTTAAEGEDLECGLPDTPACRIDETGTPETVPELEDPQQKADDVYKPLADIVEDPESFWPELPEFNWSFQLPTGCGILNVPAFEPFLTGIDVCQFQPMFHDIMSVVWVMGGLFGAIGLFWRNTMATQ